MPRRILVDDKPVTVTRIISSRNEWSSIHVRPCGLVNSTETAVHCVPTAWLDNAGAAPISRDGHTFARVA